MHDLGVEPPEQWCCDAIVLSQPCYDLSDEDVFRKMSCRHFVSNDGNIGVDLYVHDEQFLLFGGAWGTALMCPLATSMFRSNTALLWWTLYNVPLTFVIKPTVVKESLQWRSERRAQVQSYVNQPEITSEFNFLTYNAKSLVERHFGSKNDRLG